MKSMLPSRQTLIAVGIVLLLTLIISDQAEAKKLSVVCTTSDLAALVREVGGDRVGVESIAKGYQDPHFVEAKPSFLLMLRRADLVVTVGLQLEIGWLPPLLTQCGNPKIQPGAAGYLEASQFAEILDIPTGPVSRAAGDVHPLGNPHYWLDPANGRRMAKGISERLGQLDSVNASYFAERFKDFDQRLATAEQRWDTSMKPYRGRKVVTYHNSVPNFARRFGLNVIGYVEPRPGIPPSPRHTIELINLMKRENCRIIMVEPYFDLKTPNAVARDTGAKLVEYLPSVGGEKGVDDYIKLFDYNIDLLTKAFAAAR